MRRPPCCDKDGIKKGPWTPEEDIILVSYIQQHGPGNWRSVPTNTGLQRCSKSCRLRWTNYLRPGIKRGNFTPHEEGMIIHLQAILGNKWAAIASYLPQRTDNDIKNYWNTHLKKKLKRIQQDTQATPTTMSSMSSINDDDYHHNINDNHGHNNMGAPPQPSSSCYASSTENISRLLQNWMKCSPSSKPNNNNNGSYNNDDHHVTFDHGCMSEEDDQFNTMLSFENLNNNDHIISTSMSIACSSAEEDTKGDEKLHDNNMDDDENNPPLTFLEKWLLDESTTSSRHVADDVLRLPSIF